VGRVWKEESTLTPPPAQSEFILSVTPVHDYQFNISIVSVISVTAREKAM
jgi:hypothetical protein